MHRTGGMVPFEEQYSVREILPILMPGLPCWELGKDSAASLFAQGRPEAYELLRRLPGDGLAIVGTRNPHVRSAHLARSWIRALGGSRRVLISGFAKGIDTVAHESALEAGLPTIAFLGTPLDVDYPRGQRSLRRRILESGGLLVSEYPRGTFTHKSHFTDRNRLIAGFSRAVLIVEAGMISGTLNTADWAARFHRDLYVVPCAPGDPRFAGNQKLLEGSGPKPFWGPHCLGDSWYEYKGRNPSAEPPEAGPAAELLTLLRERTYRAGGVPMDEAIAWAMAREWPAGEFFEWLERNLSNGRIGNRGGLLVSSPPV